VKNPKTPYTSNSTQSVDLPPVVLLVDDEPYNIDLLEQELSGLGLELIAASNGREALARVAELPPDMIFLDLMMPVMDGFGVLEALQANELWREIPVVIISASNDLVNIVRGIEMGATDFLPKPFEPAIDPVRLFAHCYSTTAGLADQGSFSSCTRGRRRLL
jgi:CheY-like chemotaxis protein